MKRGTYSAIKIAGCALCEKLEFIVFRIRSPQAKQDLSGLSVSVHVSDSVTAQLSKVRDLGVIFDHCCLNICMLCSINPCSQIDLS